MNKYSLLFLCFLQTSVYGIEPRWFEIEIIVFEQSNQSRLDAEKWEQQVSLPDVSNSRDFLTAEAHSVNLQQICLLGKMQPVLGMIPVNEIIENDEIIEKINPEELTITDNNPLSQPLVDMNTEIEAVELREEEEPEKPFIILDKELNQLNELRSQLARRRGYRPLLHISWRQPVENKKNSQSIRLFSGKNHSETFNPEGDARIDIAKINSFLSEDYQPVDTFSNSKQTTYNEQNSPVDTLSAETTPFDSNSSSLLPFNEEVLLTAEDYNRTKREHLSQCQTLYAEQIAQRHADVWQLDGNIRIYVERYLHLETDLLLRIPGTKEIHLGAIETSLAADKLLDSMQTDELDLSDKPTTNTFGWKLADDFLSDDHSQSMVVQQVLNKYPMQQSRRIRSNEIHYIDHPLYGLLIQIRPYEKESEDEDVPTAS